MLHLPRYRWLLMALSILVSMPAVRIGTAADPDVKALDKAYVSDVRPLLRRYCYECHSEDRAEADVDLTSFATLADVRKHPKTWQKVREMLESGQMPPKEVRQPSDTERDQLKQWVRRYLTMEAQAHAGDPGRVVLRRLSNAEYTYTLRDLTGVNSLDPAREFPVDGAAGEGFTNTGNALVMSPALITKYLDAAKEVADHLVLLPDGIRFSPDTTRSDWTNETLARIRDFYREYSDNAGGDKVNLQGIVFDTNQGGRLPVERYLAATLEERDALQSGTKSIEQIARERHLSPKYLGGLWQILSRAQAKPNGTNGTSQRTSLLVDALRTRWQSAKPDDAHALAAEIAQWQQALWRFTSVGHIGKLNGPKAWMEPVTPIAASQEIKLKLPASTDGKEVVVYLTAGDAGDGNDHDIVVWERPRLVAPGRPDLLLRDVRAVTGELAAHRERLVAEAAKSLDAAAEASAGQSTDVKSLAKKHGVDADSLAAWLDYLGIGAGGPVKLGTPISRKIDSLSGYDFIKGWVGDDALSVIANSTDQAVRVPGNMKPHSIAVHPTPKLAVAVGWRSPMAATMRIEGAVQHAHPECGNGVAWTVELRRGNTRQRLAAGVSQGAKGVQFGPLEKIAVQAGDVIVLAIDPRDGNHSCDLTAIDLTLRDGTREWNLSRDLSSDILAGNPHKDSLGNADVWHFFSEPTSGSAGQVIPAGSLLARWQSAESADEKHKRAEELQKLLQTGPGALAKDSPDLALYQQLTSLGGPLLSAALHAIAAKPAGSQSTGKSSIGLDPALFGKQPKSPATPVDAASLCVRAPSVIELRLPADLVAGAELLATGKLHPVSGKEGSVQLQVLTTKPESAVGLKPAVVTETRANGPWTSNNRGLAYGSPIVVTDGSQARQRFETSFGEFRNWFPAALCYTKIVPVDEVVTLTLFYREDDQLRRLMLDDAQTSELDRLWNELHFLSRDALTLVDAFAQLMEYATQDADPKVFEPLRQPINERASAFRKLLVDSEPKHLAALLDFATRVYRRPLIDAETTELRGLYRRLREQEIPHEEAIRLTFARMLVAPAFLYKVEMPRPGTAQSPVSDWELANRLSFFLWSSLPDDELRSAAAAGGLHKTDALVSQTRRMLKDARVRRLSIEFACHWLHIHHFDHLDEKSERHFPTFVDLREAMYEESIRFFTDLFQNNGSVLDILSADHTFVNDELAKHYGIPLMLASAGAPSSPDKKGTADWRRVDGLKQHGRGGILAHATTLATQSGASRTSPILRGNWISEVLLGERLPRPPKDVPRLPEDESATEGLTVRQLVEQHSSNPKCAVCHQRIDAFGFSLEGFDAIGRRREKDLGDRLIDTRVKTMDGAEFEGLDGLRNYLLTVRRDAFVRQFCKKLLGYALGREVQLSDEPLLVEMQSILKAHDYKIDDAVEAIVRSRQFREIRGRETADDE